jgi:hypothetical protein
VAPLGQHGRRATDRRRHEFGDGDPDIGQEGP